MNHLSITNTLQLGRQVADDGRWHDWSATEWWIT